MKVLKFPAACLACVAVLGGSFNAQAISVPSPSASISVTTGGQTVDIPVELVRTDKGWAWDIDVETGEYGITGEGTLNPDPAIAYGIAVVDFGAPSVFGFSFGTPIVPTGPSTVVAASIVGGLTDFTGDGISLTPTGPTVQTSAVGFPLTPMGVDVGPAFSAPAGGAGAFHAYGPHAAGPVPGPAGVFTFLTVSAGFGLSGGGDVAALTGFASIEDAAVPDAGAGTAALLMVGALAVIGVARGRAGLAS
jgi:hypothetical protein